MLQKVSGERQFLGGFKQDSFPPNHLLFLDGWIQSSLFNEAAYHEALVHQALFTHQNPKGIAIIGGGEVATLRKVLKHNSIRDVCHRGSHDRDR